MRRALTGLLAFSALFLGACSAIFPEPTATPRPTGTPTPTYPPSMTPPPTTTSTVAPPTTTPTLVMAPNLVPEGTPTAEWNGFPIMPGALAGSGDSGSYRFTIKATAVEIQLFYQKELVTKGWELFPAGVGQSGTILLIFSKGSETLPISIIPYQEDMFIVMLVQ